MKSKLSAFFFVFFLVGLDQWTKSLAVKHLKDQAAIPIVENVFELFYLENRGAAFGMFQNQRWIFLLLTFIIVAAVIYLFCKLPVNQRFLPMRICCVFMVAGALGNMIDRLLSGYVVDFFYFRLIDFPVFNIADIYVTVTAVAAMLLYLFYYKEDEWKPLFDKNKGED